MEKVFGVGLNKTGTTTLGQCMRVFGSRHLSHSEEFARLYRYGQKTKLLAIANDFDSFEDWPWPLMYKEAAVEFPDAKFILTVRKSAQVWLKSLVTHSYKLPPEENYHELIYGYKYPLGHKAYHLEFYNNHNASVIDHFRDQPGRLSVLCWENGDGWPELCNFLGVDTPDVPFPRSGATKDWNVPPSRIFHNRLLAIMAVGARNELVNNSSEHFKVT